MDKMRDIKSEIGDLMNKIDHASKHIQESFKQPLLTNNKTPSSFNKNEEMTTMIHHQTTN